LDDLVDQIRAANETENSGNTLLPVVMVLSVFLIFLSLVVYCYRHRTLSATGSQPDLYLLPLQETPAGSIVPQAGSSNNDSDSELEHIHVGLNNVNVSNHDLLVRRAQPPRSPLSSAVGTDSDHGYSTMTHHEDSECGAPLPIACLDPPPVHLSKRRPLVDLGGISCSSSCSSSYVPPVHKPNKGAHKQSQFKMIVPVSIHQVNANISSPTAGEIQIDEPTVKDECLQPIVPL